MLVPVLFLPTASNAPRTVAFEPLVTCMLLSLKLCRRLTTHLWGFYLQRSYFRDVHLHIGNLLVELQTSTPEVGLNISLPVSHMDLRP